MQRRRSLSLLLFAAIFAAGLSPTYQAFSSLPSEVTLPRGHLVRLTPLPGLSLSGTAGHGDVVSVPQSGRGSALVRLFGGPVMKRIRVSAVSERQVVVGGGAIGIDMALGRPTVVGFSAPARNPFPWCSPARDAGLRLGDRIVAVGSTPVFEGLDLTAAVDEAGRHHRAVVLRMERDGHTLERRLAPFYDQGSGTYRIGVYVRDRLTGVGTVTLADPKNGTWAALGHAVAHESLKGDGDLYPASIAGITPGHRGSPGAKIGLLLPGAKPIGHVTGSTPVGVVGTLAHPPRGRMLPVAEPDEVHTGPATLYTVLERGRIEGFRVLIERKLLTRGRTSKALIVRATDPDLLARTGGIVQGMSGSPLVQDHHLVAAVTHVFVNDPTRGFAVYASWMLDAANRQGG